MTILAGRTALAEHRQVSSALYLEPSEELAVG